MSQLCQLCKFRKLCLVFDKSKLWKKPSCERLLRLGEERANVEHSKLQTSIKTGSSFWQKIGLKIAAVLVLVASRMRRRGIATAGAEYGFESEILPRDSTEWGL